MSALKFTDHGLSCDHDGCGRNVWGSALELRDGFTLTMLRKKLAVLGWKTGVKRYSKMDQYIPEILDFCVNHAVDAEEYERWNQD